MAGMLPILREYVELLFQARLIKVVFATETLAVGVNMPARTVVFTQLDKPDNQVIHTAIPPLSHSKSLWAGLRRPKALLVASRQTYTNSTITSPSILRILV
jgi:superfamily II RNA helicase